MLQDFIPTRGSSTKPKGSINFHSVTYESYKPINSSKTSKTSERVIDANPDEFNIKKAKHEVIKFGMTGFDPQKKEEAKMQLAIKLGAKPLKNKYKNYKVLKEERAKQKEEEKLKLQFQQLGKKTAGKPLAKTKRVDQKRKRNMRGILTQYGVAKNVRKN